eukprot:509229-Pelagomonas_calceolata.AAC.2
MHCCDEQPAAAGPGAADVHTPALVVAQWCGVQWGGGGQGQGWVQGGAWQGTHHGHLCQSGKPQGHQNCCPAYHPSPGPDAAFRAGWAGRMRVRMACRPPILPHGSLPHTPLIAQRSACKLTDQDLKHLVFRGAPGTFSEGGQGDGQACKVVPEFGSDTDFRCQDASSKVVMTMLKT